MNKQQLLNPRRSGGTWDHGWMDEATTAYSLIKRHMLLQGTYSDFVIFLEERVTIDHNCYPCYLLVHAIFLVWCTFVFVTFQTPPPFDS